MDSECRCWHSFPLEGSSMFHQEKDLLERFFERRNQLIDRLTAGEIDKNIFLKENLLLIRQWDIRPYGEIHTFLAGMYNYQYYNILAKEAHIIVTRWQDHPKKKRLCSRQRSLRDSYYSEKDKATMGILTAVGYRNVEAYYIEMNSKRLNDRLFEIHLQDYEKAVLHSMNEMILEELKKNGVFDEKVRPSLIDTYVNRNYY